MSVEREIEVTKDGPYLVSGNVPLKKEKIVNDAEGFPSNWKSIKKYQTKKQYSLCRCGHSKNKPYCDQSHKCVSFNGQETANNVPFDKQAEVIDGPKLTLKDAPSLCAHARFCDRAGGIWELTRKSNEEKSKINAIDEACNCPSGRLVEIDKSSHKRIEPVFDKSISATEDAEGIVGPLWVKGGIPIKSTKGKIYEIRNRVTLCRCGHSKNKPFCDGTHLLSKENTMNPIVNLTLEHGLIKIMLSVLKKINKKFIDGEHVETDDLNNGIIFINEFADKCHHGKEEDWLFPVMKKNSIPREVRLIEILLKEHAQGRGYIKNMAEAISKKKEDNLNYSKIFLDNSRKYVALLDQHIVKENMILFTGARQTISQSQMKKLEEGFKDIEENKVGPERYEELYDIFYKLKDTYF